VERQLERIERQQLIGHAALLEELCRVAHQHCRRRALGVAAAHDEDRRRRIVARVAYARARRFADHSVILNQSASIRAIVIASEAKQSRAAHDAPGLLRRPAGPSRNDGPKWHRTSAAATNAPPSIRRAPSRRSWNRTRWRAAAPCPSPRRASPHAA